MENLAKKDGGLSFSRLDGALPFFPSDAVSILPWAPILEELNDYRLKVTGLAAGKYEVRSRRQEDRRADCRATRRRGQSGCLESLAEGPIADQAKSVEAAVENKNSFHHDSIFRGIVLSDVPDWIYQRRAERRTRSQKAAIITGRLAKLAALDAEVAKTLVMKANTFEIVPAK